MSETFGLSAIQTSDKGYLFLVNVGNSSNQYNGFIKTDSLCNEIWSKFYSMSFLGPVSQTADSGYILVAQGSNITLIRTNSIGDIIWSKSYGGLGGYGATSVLQTNDSGFIAIGSITGFGAGGIDIYVVKTDPNGDTLWSKTYGGTGNDIGMDIKQTPDSGFIITGSTTSFGPDSVNAYLIKTDVNGDVTWSKTYGSGGSWSTKIELTSNGGYNIYCGNVVIKTDALGDTLKIIKSGIFVQQTSDGGYLQLGLVKTDSNGVSCYGSLLPPVFGIGNPVTQTTQPTTVVNNLTVTSWTASIYNAGIWAPDSTICFSVGINEIKQNAKISFSPNPFSFSSTLTISDNVSLVDLTLSVFNIDGRMVRQTVITSHESVIERNGMAAGIYFYKITSGSTAKAFGKLLFFKKALFIVIF
jgi:hypothetical protein